MSYRINPGESVEHAVQRIAQEQIKKMFRSIDDPTIDRAEAVHDLRKRCKKLRGLIRLVRGQFRSGATYQEENAWYRDAAGKLSTVRDAQTMVETFDSLLERFSAQVEVPAFASVRQQLLFRRDSLVNQQLDLDARLEMFRARMQLALKRCRKWQLKSDGPRAVSEGLQQTYRRACQAQQKTRKQATTENLHQWRKRVKYHWYHCRLIRPIWPEEMKARAHLASDLSDLLGDDHDLALLAEALATEPDTFGDPDILQTTLALIHARRKELQLHARWPGKRLLAESPSALSDRLAIYWKAWKKQQKYRPETLLAPELKLATE